jgi:hypothetical protein
VTPRGKKIASNASHSTVNNNMKPRTAMMDVIPSVPVWFSVSPRRRLWPLMLRLWAAPLRVGEVPAAPEGFRASGSFPKRYRDIEGLDHCQTAYPRIDRLPCQYGSTPRGEVILPLA